MDNSCSPAGFNLEVPFCFWGLLGEQDGTSSPPFGMFFLSYWSVPSGGVCGGKRLHKMAHFWVNDGTLLEEWLILLGFTTITASLQDDSKAWGVEVRAA